jgi:putative Mn2+ efflux pump MntP
MNEDIIQQIEPTPKISSKRCKMISFGIRVFFYTFTFISAFIGWYLYDYFIAILAMLLGFIVTGIVRSKLRNSAIPPAQREYQYSDKEIADWYSAKLIC